MNEEKVKCPICRGLKCRLIPNFGLKVCKKYMTEEVCVDTCYLKCSTCQGTGYVTWIDSLFTPNISKYTVQQFEANFQMINDDGFRYISPNEKRKLRKIINE